MVRVRVRVNLVRVRVRVRARARARARARVHAAPPLSRSLLEAMRATRVCNGTGENAPLSVFDIG